MTLRIPNAAEEAFLDLMLSENMTLRLFTNDVESGLSETQKEALTAGSFTEATFTGYSAAALTGGSWVTTQGDDFSLGTYAMQTFTRTSTGTPQVIRGYYVTRTTGGALRWYEYFPGPITVTNNGDAIRVTPTFTFDDDREATVQARGIVARQVLTSSGSGLTASGLTDMVLNNVPVVAGRLYGIRLHSHFTITSAARWDMYVRLNGVDLDLLMTHEGTAATDATREGMVTWEAPTTQATDDFTVFANELTGTSTLTLFATAGLPRTFEIFDLGVAP